MLISDEELSRVTKLAEKQVAVEGKIAKLEEDLATANEELKQVREKELPAIMQEIGITAFTLASGRKISLKTDIYASIPKEDGGRAFAWLRNNNFGAIIKNVISCNFGKDEDEKAIEAARLLASAGYTPEQKESVHPSTLKAFIKEQVGKGVDVPLDYFGAFVVTKSKVE